MGKINRAWCYNGETLAEKSIILVKLCMINFEDNIQTRIIIKNMNIIMRYDNRTNLEVQSARF